MTTKSNHTVGPELQAGDSHYTAYVGPPERYDFMGATQFRLLCALGMRAHHRLLDFGCGSLRAGRLFLPYLDVGCYFGIEPNARLIEAAFDHQIGRDIIDVKKPQFAHVSDFSVPFDQSFDFILAQSIFSHTGLELVDRALSNLARTLTPNGLIVATFVEGSRDYQGAGWVYPGVVAFRPSTIRHRARKAGLYVRRLPWYHPRQTWYLLAKNPARLPGFLARCHLLGAVLFDPDFRDSRSFRRRAINRLRLGLAPWVPVPVKALLKKFKTGS